MKLTIITAATVFAVGGLRFLWKIYKEAYAEAKKAGLVK